MPLVDTELIKKIVLYQTNRDLGQNTLGKCLLNEFIPKSP